MVWQKNGVLVCDTCTMTIDWENVPHIVVMNKARSMGWHCYEGPSLGGDKLITSHICPQCMGTSRSKLPPAPKLMEEDQPLFVLEEKPHVHGGAENQEKAGPRSTRRPIRRIPPL